MGARVALLVAGGVGAVLAGLVVALVALSPGEEPRRPSARSGPDRAHSAVALVRTVVIHRGRREPAPSRPGGAMHALLLKGKPPSRAVMATVTSDEDCAPDAAGISHCLNRLTLEDGRRVAVRHPHAMQQVPCMTPGERVRVVPG